MNTNLPPDPLWDDAELTAAFEAIGKPLTKTREDRMPNGGAVVEYCWSDLSGGRHVELKSLGKGRHLAQRGVSLSGRWDSVFDEAEAVLDIFAEHCVPPSAIDALQTLVNRMDEESESKVESPAAILRGSRRMDGDSLQLRLIVDFR